MKRVAPYKLPGGSALERQFAFDLHALGVEAPVCQVTKVVPGRQFRFDFGWVDRRILVEIQGGEFSKGAHVRGARMAEDFIKHNLAVCLGWQVYLFTGKQVKESYAAKFMKQVLDLHKAAAKAAGT